MSSIDPHPVKYKAGALSVNKVWYRIAIDIVHVRSQSFLSIVDCGPGRFAIWKMLNIESSTEIVNSLATVLFERGFVAEILSDNAKVFKSEVMVAFCRKWNMRQLFSCKYEPSGNGIVERCHKTIKRMVARTNGSVMEMLFWYNVTPHYKQNPLSVPFSHIYNYSVNLTGYDAHNRTLGVCPFFCHQHVFVKSKNTSCMQKWSPGTITKIISPWNVEVDGVSVHVRNVREDVHFND